MKNKNALNQHLFDSYSSLNNGNTNKFLLNSCKCQYSICNQDCECLCHVQKVNYNKKSNKTIEQTFDLINNYKKTRNTNINANSLNNINNLIDSNDQKKNKKLEFSKSMDRILKPNDFRFNFNYNDNSNENKTLAKISKEINQFKDKMNKDKEYLNNIQYKLFTSDIGAIAPNSSVSSLYYNNEINDNRKNRKRTFSLSNRNFGYKILTNNNKNLNYELNDYYTDNRKLKNAIISNKFIDNDLLYSRNLNNENKESNFSKNYIIDYTKRNSSSFHNKNYLLNKYLFNSSINNNYEKNNYYDNNNNVLKQSKTKEGLNDNKFNNNYKYEYISYPGNKVNEKKQNYYPNMKYLTIQIKDDKIQLKEKEIKVNDINSSDSNNLNNKKDSKNYINKSSIDNEFNNYVSLNNEKTKVKKDILNPHMKKYDNFVKDIIKDNNKDNTKENINSNDKSKKMKLNNIDILSNYEIIKSKYEKSINKFNDLSNAIIHKNLVKVKSEIYQEKKEEEKKQIIFQNRNDNNATEKSINKSNDFTEQNKLKSKKYSKSNSISSNFILDTQKNSFISNNYMTISTFYITIQKKEDNNKDLLIKTLKQKIIELENQLKMANSKIKEFSKIMVETKNKNQILSIDKIASFNYINIQNHIIKLNNRNLNISINNNKKKPKLNNDDLFLEFSKRSSIGKSPSKYINTTSENEFSYSSFDNYKNMNIYFRKITTTVNDQKIFRTKAASLSKNSIKNNQNILSNKLNIKKEIINNNLDINSISSIKANNSNLIKDMKINEKIIYAIYPSKDDISLLLFDPEIKKFSLQKFVDNSNFKENYKKSLKINKENSDINSHGNIFLYNEGYLYVVTGDNYDIFYKFDCSKKEVYKLSNLKNNHSNGCLIFYDQRIFCLNGDFNKKVECYIESKNEWIEIPEMLTERSNFSCCIIQEQYLFALFGYNNISKQYLNSIEFIDLLCENAKWKYLYYENINNLSLYLIGSLGISFNGKTIIIFGGYDGKSQKGNNFFYQINLKKNFDEENYEINDENLSNITKIKQEMEINNESKYYFFGYNYNKFYDEKNTNLFLSSFDNEFHAHIINLNTFSHEIYNFE